MNFLSSVVTLLTGATAWTFLASLPKRMNAQASIVGGRIRLIESLGDGGEVLEYHPHPWDQWVTIGNIQHSRSAHATLSIGVEQLPCFMPGESFNMEMIMLIESS